MTTRPRTGMKLAVGHVDYVEHAPTPLLVDVAAEKETRVSDRDRVAQDAPRTTWRYWKRVALRALGVPYDVQNVLLDPYRWTITVTRHAIEQAGERYRDGNPAVITRDVADAIAANRIARNSPGRYYQARGRARLAWTEDGGKAYVVRRARRAWIVITALPNDEDFSS